MNSIARVKTRLPAINAALYAILILAAPFLMVKAYLQNAIRDFGRASVSIFGLNLPIFATLAALALIVWLALNARKISKKRIAAAAFLLLAFAYGQYVADYYIDYVFYDLQNNWHYLAYFLFVFVLYRYFQSRKTDLAKTFLAIFFLSFALSAFDETFQLFASNRVFDISDVAKDLWGTALGLFALSYAAKEGKIFKGEAFPPKSFKKVLKSPLSVLWLEIIFAAEFLAVSSLLASVKYLPETFAATLIIYSVSLAAIALARRKKARKILLGALFGAAVWVLVQIFTAEPRLTKPAPRIAFYKNLPIPFFDFAIFPDKSFRLVDKKIHFKRGDLAALLKREPNVIIIDRGFDDAGGKELETSLYSSELYFVYDAKRKNLVQFFSAPSPEAAKEYNRLLKTNAKVLYVGRND